MIYTNRENQNTYGLAIKVFSPLLLSLTILMWDMFSNEVKGRKSFVSIGVFDEEDGFPINLGGIYFNVYNQGIGYSSLTTAYRSTTFKEKIHKIWKEKHPYEPDKIINGIQKYKKKEKFEGKHIYLGELSLELVGVGIMHNFLKRLYRYGWETERKKYKSLGGGMSSLGSNQKDNTDNSSNFKLKDLMKNMEISLIKDVEYSGFTIPKSGKYSMILKSNKSQFGDLSIQYTSKYIKDYTIKVSLFQNGKLNHGKFVEALRTHTDPTKLCVFYYDFDIQYETYWYNKWSPQAKKEVEWIERQMDLLEDYYSFIKTEDDMIYALKNNNPETTDLTIEGR